MGKVITMEAAIAKREKALAVRCAKYGITVEQYRTMLALQGNACKLCLKIPLAGKRGLEIDHDHKTQRVRGLLCWFCNHKRLGRARTPLDAVIYARAAAYLISDFDARAL